MAEVRCRPNTVLSRVSRSVDCLTWDCKLPQACGRYAARANAKHAGKKCRYAGTCDRDLNLRIVGRRGRAEVVTDVGGKPAIKFCAATACARVSASPVLPLQTELRVTGEYHVVPDADSAAAPAKAAASAVF